MHVAVTAVGRDRPGIVSAVTAVLFEHGGNIEDSRMAILGGQFAMMLIVATDADPAALEEDIARATRTLDLVVTVRRVDDTMPGSAGGDPYILSVYGADHPGIVYRVTQALAERSVNVTDLATRVVGGAPPVYVMIMEITLPAELTGHDLEAGLRTLADELGVDLSLRAADADTL